MEIKLRNGSVLKCEAREGCPQESDNYELLKFFIRNAWYFYHHRERIYADSKLFLAQVPLKIRKDEWAFVLENTQGGRRGSVSDEGCTATLGGILESWENDSDTVFSDEAGNYGLAYQLSAHNRIVHLIKPDSRSYRVEITHLFKGGLKDKERHQQYSDASAASKTLTLMEVKAFLARETGSDEIDEVALKYEQLLFRYSEYSGGEKMLKIALESLHDRYMDMLKELCYYKREEIRPHYERCMAIKAKQDAEMERIDGELRALRQELRRTGDPEVQRRYQKLMQDKEDLEYSDFNGQMDRLSIVHGANPLEAMAYAKEYEAKLKERASLPPEKRSSVKLKRHLNF